MLKKRRYVSSYGPLAAGPQSRISLEWPAGRDAGMVSMEPDDAAATRTKREREREEKKDKHDHS